MGDTSETNTKVLYRELFLGVVALKTPITQNHYLRDKVPFLKSGHKYATTWRIPTLCTCGIHYIEKLLMYYLYACNIGMKAMLHMGNV